MKKYEHILIPLDGSKLAEEALEDGILIAKSTGAKVTLLRVVPPVEIILSAPGYQYFVDEQWELMRIAAIEYLTEVRKRFQKEEVEINTEVILGPATDMILVFCEKQKVDLIVMGTHGRSGVKRWMIGSVADKVSRASTCPVMLVRSHQSESVKRIA